MSTMPNPLLKACSYCGAQPGQHCRIVTGRNRGRPTMPHESRKLPVGTAAADHAVGQLLVGLSEMFSTACANGDHTLAERWADAAFRVAAGGEFVDREARP